MTATEARERTQEAIRENELVKEMVEEIEHDIEIIASSGKNFYTIPDGWPANDSHHNIEDMVMEVLREHGFTVAHCEGKRWNDRCKNPDYWEISW